MEKSSLPEKANKAFSQAKKFFRQSVESAKRKPQALIAAAVIVGVFATFATFALPAAVWVAQPSTNCPAQAAGNVMVAVDNYVYVLGTSTGQSFWRFEPATGICNATPLADPPNASLPTWGASMEKVDNDTIYAHLGGSVRDLYMYKITQNQWYIGPNTRSADTTNADLIPMFGTTQGNGTKIFGLNNEVYYFGGTSLTKKYRPLTNDWVDLTGQSLSNGAAFTAVGNRIYGLISGTQFRSFDTLQTLPGSWVNEDNIPTSLNGGGALAAVNDQIYIFLGGNTNSFYRYDTTAASGSRWKTTMIDNSTPLTTPPDFIYGGGSLVYPGTGNYLYALQGSNQKNFWRYDLVNNTWTAMALTPGRVGPGGSLASDGTNIYATQGNASREIWRYNIANNRWNDIADGPLLDSTFYDVGSNFTTDIINNPQKTAGGLTFIASGNSGGGELFVTTGNRSTSLWSGDILRMPLTGTNANKFPLWNSPRSPNLFGEGTALTYPGISAQDPNGDNLFILNGASTASFSKYLIPYNTYIPWYRSKITIDGDPNMPLSQNLPLLTTAVQQSSGSTMTEVDGKFYYLFGGSFRFYRFDPVRNEWEKLTDTPDTVSRGAAMVKIDNNTIYVLGGSNNTWLGESRGDFWKYDISNDQWLAYTQGKLEDNSTIHQNFGTAVQGFGNSIEVVNGKFYSIWGGSAGLYKYDPALNTWSLLFSTLSNGRGSSMEAVGTDIYWMATSSGSGTLVRYNTLTNTTTNLATMGAGTPSEGAAGSGNGLIYPGSGNFLYAFKGYLTGSNRANRQFWRYSISGNSWTQMANTPQDIDGGASLTVILSDPDNLYAVAGGRSKEIWRYNITSDTWSSTQTNGATVFAKVPDEVMSGAELETDGTYLYLTQGGEKYTFWRYDFISNSWLNLANVPTEVGFACAASTGGNCTSDGGDMVFYDPTSGLPGSGDEEMWLVSGNGVFGPKTGSGACLLSQTKACGVLYRYKIATDEWPVTQKPEPAPSSIGTGASLSYPGTGNFIYGFKGNSFRDFWTYDMANNRWRSMYEPVLDSGVEIATPSEISIPINNSTANVNQGVGSDMVEINGKIYMNMGDSSVSSGDNVFMSFDPINNAWTQLPDSPFPITTSSSYTLLKYDNNTIYVRQHNSSGMSMAKYIIDADPGKAGDQGVWSVFNLGLRDDGVPLNQSDMLRIKSIVQSGGKFYALSDDSTTPFRSYDPVTNEWTTLQWAPVTINSNSDLVAVGSDEIYAILGSNNFYKYTISQNHWTVLTANSGSCSSGGGTGSSLTYHTSSNHIYRIKGGNTAVLCRYNVATQSWDGTARTAAPGNITGGGSSTIIGDNIYVNAGGGTTNFWRYNITNNRWNNTLDGEDPTNGGSTTLNDLTPSPMFSGGSLTTDGTHIYAIKGSKSNTFWKYDPAGITGSRWTAMTPAPAKFNQSQASTSSDGGELTFYDPTPGSPGSGDEDIWAVTGNNSEGYSTGSNSDPTIGGALFRYKIATNVWPYLASPQVAENGSLNSNGLAYSGNGTYTTDDTTDTLTDTNHGLGNNSKLTLTTTGAFPGNLSAGPYYVINATTNTFQLTTIPGGAAIDITSSGSGTQSYAASYIYGLYTTTQFGRYDVTTNEWTYYNRPKYTGSTGVDMISEYGLTQGLGATIIALNNIIYSVPGQFSERFFSYNPATNSWTELDNLPASSATFGTGATMTTVGSDSIYAINNTTSNFYRYSVAKNGWIALANPPAGASHGDGLAYPGSGDFIYLLRGNTTTTMYRYCFQNTTSGCTVNTWATSAGTTPATITSGGDLVAVGGALYATRGGNNVDFYKYTITNSPAAGDGTWSSMANMRASGNYTPDQSTDILTSTSHGLGNGAKLTLATTGTFPTGLGSGPYFVINATTDTFQISSTQGGSAVNFTGNGTGIQSYTSSYTQNSGTSLTTDGTDIYATAGNGTTGIMKYTVATNIWTVLPALPTTAVVGDGGNTKGGITYLSSGPSGGAELYITTGNDIYQAGTNTSAMLYAMPFTGTYANTWPMVAEPADFPATMATGGSIIHPGIGQKIYALQGGSVNVWSYDTSTNAWNAFDPANTPAAIGGGAELTTNGVDTLYTARGGANSEIYAYCFTTGPNCGTADVWSSLTNFRTTVGGTNDRGGMVYLSTGPSGGPELYLTTGYGQSYTVQSNTSTTPGRKLLFRYPFTGTNANTWPINNRTPLAQPDINVGAGGSLVYSNGVFDGANGSFYALLGNSTNNFRKFTITNSPNTGDGTWSTPITSGLTGTVSTGGSLVSDNSGTVLYAIKGGGTTDFQKYTITSSTGGTWTNPTAPPITHGFNNGGELTYFDNKLWMMTGKGTSEMEDTYSQNYNGLMYIYDIAGNTWPFHYPAADLPISSNLFTSGSDLASTPDGLTIYALRGTSGSAPTIANPNFWKYTISGSGVGTWATQTNLPNNTILSSTHSGGALAAISNSIIYATRGGNNYDFYRFDAGGTPGSEWSSQASLPASIGTSSGSSETGDIVWSQKWGNIYMTPGNDTTTSPYPLYSFPVNRLVITLVEKTGGGTPIAGQSMDVTVQAVDYADNPITVGNNVAVTLGINTGTGVLGGTITGTITSGNSSTIISGTTYDRPDGGVVFSASDTTAPANAATYATSNSDPVTIDGATPNITSLGTTSGPRAGRTGVTINGNDFYTNYKRTVTFNNSNTSTLTDHAAPITLDTASLIADGKMRSDCGDLRFVYAGSATTNYGAAAQIPYWIESGCNSLNTIVWVKVPAISPSSTYDLDMFYGDNRLTSNSSGNDTFAFFDDFTGTTLNSLKWAEVDSSSNVTLNNKLFLSSGTNQGIYSIADGTEGSSDGDNHFNRTNNLVLEYDFKSTGTSSTTVMGWKDTTDTLGGTTTVVGSGGFIHGINYNGTSTGTNDVIENGASTNSTNTQRWSTNRDYKVRVIMRNAASGNGAIYQRSWDNGKTWVTWLTNTTRTDANARIGFSNTTTAVEIDNVRVYTYAPNALTATYSVESPNMNVTFDGLSSTITSVTPTQVKVLTPYHASATVDVVITNGDGQIDTATNAFTYVDPAITNLTPDSGDPSGNTPITITGTNFSPYYYRRAITIDNSSGGALTDYQIPITFDSAALIATGKMHPLGHDIRFYDTDQTTQIPNYWIEGPMDSTATKVWVKVPSIPAASTKIIYLEYGYLSLDAVSPQTSIANTFIREIDSLSLAASYPMDETSGNVSDFSGNNNTGTSTNTTSVTGKFGSARNFDGSTSFINAGNNSAAQLLGGFSIELWMNMTATSTTPRLVSKSTSASASPNINSGYQIMMGQPTDNSSTVCGRSGNIANIPVFELGENQSTTQCVAPTVAPSPVTGTWHHIVATFDPTTITGRVYVDGVQTGINSALPTEATATSTESLTIGRASSSTSRYFNGVLDDVRLYSKALSASEISDLYGTSPNNNQGYTTSEYPGRVLVRQAQTTEPGITLGAETGTLEVTFDSALATVISATNTTITLTNPPHPSGPGVVPVVVSNAVDGAQATGTYEYAILIADKTKTTVVATPTSGLEADGADSSTVTVTLLTTGDDPVPNHAVTLAQLTGTVSGTVITPIDCPNPEPAGLAPGTSNVNGKACFTVKTQTPGASDYDGAYTYEATDTYDSIVFDDSADHPSITFVPEVTHKTNSTVTAPGGVVTADGASTKTITVTLKNRNDIHIPNRTIRVNQISGPGTANIVPNSADTDSSGIRTFTVATTVAGTYTFQAEDIEATPNVLLDDIADTITVVFIPGATDSGITHSTFVVDTTPLPANGTTATLTATLKDQFDNVIPDRAVSMSRITGPSAETITAIDCPTPEPAGSSPGVSNSNGKACATISATQSGTYVIQATETTSNPDVVLDQTASINFTPPSTTSSTLVASPLSTTANGSDYSLVTATIKDSSNNLFPNQSVTLSQISGAGSPIIDAVNCSTLASMATGANATTDATGNACYKVTSVNLGVFGFKATNNTESFDVTQTVSITFSEGPVWEANGKELAHAIEDNSIYKTKYSPKVVRTSDNKFISLFTVDHYPDTPYDATYIQKFDENGNHMWPNATPDTVGIELERSTGASGYGEILADSSGGAFIFWHNSNGLVGQRVDSNGNYLWGSTPKLISATGNLEYTVNCASFITGGGSTCHASPLISDGAGGVFIVYRDFAVTVGGTHRLVRLDSNGDIVSGEGWPKPIVTGADASATNTCTLGPVNLTLIRPGAVRTTFSKGVPSHSTLTDCGSFVGDKSPAFFASHNTTNPADYIFYGQIDSRSNYTVDPDLTLSTGACSSSVPGNERAAKSIEDGNGGVYTIIFNNCPLLQTQTGKLIVHYANKDGVLWNYEISPGTTSASSHFEAITDSSGGIIVLYNTEEGNGNLFLTRIRNSTGNQPEEPWNGGTRITVATQYSTDYHLVPGDTANSAVVVYGNDTIPSGETLTNAYSYYRVKKYDGNGNLAAGWPTEGVYAGYHTEAPVYNVTSDNQGKSAVADGTGGIVFVGNDYSYPWISLNSSQEEIYIQRVLSNATLPWNSGNPIEIAPGIDTIDRQLKEQQNQQMVYVGNNQYIMAWEEEAKFNFDTHASTHAIYADKFDMNGNHLWQVPQIHEYEGAGITVSYESGSPTSDNTYLDIAADETANVVNGGFLSIWREKNSGYDNIIAEKINTNGISIWDRVLLIDSDASNNASDIISDGAGGAYIAYIADNNVLISKLDSIGENVWLNGINTPGIVESNPRLVRFGSSTLYLVYEQNNVGTAKDIFVQKFDATTGVLGSSAAVNNSVGNQEIGDVIPIGSGTSGVLIAYTDDQAGPNNKQIKADCKNSFLTGCVFPSNVSDTTVNNINPRLASDNAEGAYIVWERYNAAGTVSNIAYSRLAKNNGGIFWDMRTLGDPSVNVLRQNPTIVSDGLDTIDNHSGFFVSWQQDDESNATKHIYTSHVVNGLPQEGDDLIGTAIANLSTRTDVTPTIATDLNNTTITAWTGNSSPSDVFGQNVYEADSSYNSTFISSGTVDADPAQVEYLTVTLLDQNDDPIVGHTIRIDIIHHDYPAPYDEEPTITPYVDGTYCTGGTPGVTNSNGQACFTASSLYPGRNSLLAATDITDPNNLLTLADTNSIYFGFADPVLTLLDPDNGTQAGGETINITGSGFYPSTEFFIDGVEVTSTYIDFYNAQIVTQAHSPGTVDVTALNNNEIESNPLPFTFVVSVVITNIVPSEGTQDTTVPVTIYGINIDPAATAKITLTGEPDVECTDPVVDISGTELTCNLDLTGVTNDFWDVVVTNPSSFTATLPQGFEVEAPADAGTSTVSASPSNVPANGTTASIVTVTLRDASNNPSDNETVRLTSTAGPGTPAIDAANCITGLSLGNIPANESITDRNGQACFNVTNTTRGTNTFQAQDLTAAFTITQTADVTFDCVIGPNQQCAELIINAGTGALTVTAPDDFTFPAAAAEDQSFSQDDPGYVLNTNDVVTVSDTRGSGGFNLQVQADSAGFNDGAGHFLPLQNLYVATKAATTSGSPVNGVEYSGLLTSPQNIVAYQDTTALFTNPLSFTTCGSGLGTGGTLITAGTPSPIDLMLGGLSSGGRNGDFKQNVNYYLDIPSGAFSGSYTVTLTYTVTDDTTDPPSTPSSCP